MDIPSSSDLMNVLMKALSNLLLVNWWLSSLALTIVANSPTQLLLLLLERTLSLCLRLFPQREAINTPTRKKKRKMLSPKWADMVAASPQQVPVSNIKWAFRTQAGLIMKKAWRRDPQLPQDSLIRPRSQVLEADLATRELIAWWRRKCEENLTYWGVGWNTLTLTSQLPLSLYNNIFKKA